MQEQVEIEKLTDGLWCIWLEEQEKGGEDLFSLQLF